MENGEEEYGAGFSAIRSAANFKFLHENDGPV